MRTFTGIILILVLALPWGMKVAITANFVVNQDYIAQNLCENRDKPELHCNGKCVLMQKLRLADDKPEDKPNELPLISRIEISGFLVSGSDMQLGSHYFPAPKMETPVVPSGILTLLTHDIFHPPC